MSINLTNYEEWFVAFLDNELNEQEIKKLNTFLLSHPALQAELESYKEIIIARDEEIVFEEKTLLLKKDEKLFVAWKKMWPIAASLLLAIVLFPLLKSDDVIVPKDVVKIFEPKKQVVPTSPVKNRPTNIAAVEIPEEKVVAPIKKNTRVIKRLVEKQLVTNKKKAKLIKQEWKRPAPDKIIEAPLPEVIVQRQKPEMRQEPKIYLQEEKNDEPKNVVVKTPLIIKNEGVPVEENGKALFTISEDSNPIIYEKLNEVVTKVEAKINKIKTIKEMPITVCIGKRKLFTLNTAKATQTN